MERLEAISIITTFGITYSREVFVCSLFSIAYCFNTKNILLRINKEKYYLATNQVHTGPFVYYALSAHY